MVSKRAGDAKKRPAARGCRASLGLRTRSLGTDTVFRGFEPDRTFRPLSKCLHQQLATRSFGSGEAACRKFETRTHDAFRNDGKAGWVAMNDTPVGCDQTSGNEDPDRPAETGRKPGEHQGISTPQPASRKRGQCCTHHQTSTVWCKLCTWMILLSWLAEFDSRYEVCRLI
jgi:hypothetical protein